MTEKGEWLSMADIEKYILSVMQNESKVVSSRQRQAEGASHLWVVEEGGVQI